jgi:hypothetical protein
VELPVRYQLKAGVQRVVSVDGAFDAPGLNLSHWPGNRTPAGLRRDLSTQSALAFVQLPQAEQAALAQGCTAIVNNHYDTDGNCALFALRHPELALAHAARLVEAAAAGDFFQGESEQGFAIDCIVEGIADAQRSPIAAQFVGLSELERYTRASEFLFQEFPRLLAGDTQPFEALFAPQLAALRCDLEDLGRAAKDDITHLEWCVWTAAWGVSSSRAGARGSFDPGRHALFCGAARNCALAIGPQVEGTTYRMVFSTLSWFELPSRELQPRAALEELAATLNRLEGCKDSSAQAWRCQSTATPSPELWFGRAMSEMFAEHNTALEKSRLTPAIVKRTIAEALRGALLLPQ